MSQGGLVVSAQIVLTDINLGDSIAVNGICLTVTKFTASEFTADVMPETMRRTSLAALSGGSEVNLERAAQINSRLGGHIVTGHIDGTGRISGWQEEGNAILLKVAADDNILRHTVEKGSVALDGISLTVAQVTAADFTVSLIPHTRQVTNLHTKKIGDLLNIETDIIGKYVEKLLSPHTAANSGITREFLTANGF